LRSSGTEFSSGSSWSNGQTKANWNSRACVRSTAIIVLPFFHSCFCTPVLRCCFAFCVIFFYDFSCECFLVLYFSCYVSLSPSSPFRLFFLSYFLISDICYSFIIVFVAYVFVVLLVTFDLFRFSCSLCILFFMFLFYWVFLLFHCSFC
jgi:hypothetical protein